MAWLRVAPKNKIVDIYYCSDYKVHDIQIAWLGLTVSTQNLCTESGDIGENVSNFAGLVWKADF